MTVLLANNATSRLASSLDASATTLAVTSGDGARFPSPAGGQWFPLTLINAGGSLEILKCTGRSGDVFTVARAQEGTAAQAFSAGDRVELRATKAVFDEKQPINSALTALAGVSPGADTLPYFTGTDSAAQTPLTPFARSILDDATAEAARETLDVKPGIGWGQTWKDVRVNRGFGVTYTNSTTRPIAVSVSISGVTGAAVGLSATVSGVVVAGTNQPGVSGAIQETNIFFIVPPLATYSVTQVGANAATWSELRE